MHSTPTDEALVADFLVTRHERPFTLLYKRYCRKVYRSCLRLLGDPHQAQDQAQEIFIKVYARLDTFQGKAKFSTWLFTITRYHCLALLAKQRPTRLVTLSPDMEFWEESDESALEERWEQLECALEQLLTADRDLLREKYLAQKDLATLAREAHLTLSAVKMRLKRARDKVKASLPADQRPGQSQSG